MRAPDKSACVAATVTLELGIDLGQLDQVLQVDATHTVSQFRAAAGALRGGVKATKPKCSSIARKKLAPSSILAKKSPGICCRPLPSSSCTRKTNGWSRPQIPRLPLSLLYHQTMSILYAHQGLSPPQLARRVLGLSPFRHVSAEQFRALLRHLIDIDHIQQTERGDLIIGYSAARKSSMTTAFFAVFSDDTLYRVRRQIPRNSARYPRPPAVDDTLVLAGYIWRVLRVDYEQKICRGAARRAQETSALAGRRRGHPYARPAAHAQAAAGRQPAQLYARTGSSSGCGWREIRRGGKASRSPASCRWQTAHSCCCPGMARGSATR